MGNWRKRCAYWHPSNKVLPSSFPFVRVEAVWNVVLCVAFPVPSNGCREVMSGKNPRSVQFKQHSLPFLQPNRWVETAPRQKQFSQSPSDPHTLEGCSKRHENREIISWRLAPSELTDPSVSLEAPYKPLRSAVPQNYPRLLFNGKVNPNYFPR